MTFLKSHKIFSSGFGKAFLASLFVGGLLMVVDHLSMRAGLDESQRVIDDLVGGLIAGSILYVHERRRLRRLYENKRIDELANHHIRNALQLLAFVQYEPTEAAQKEIVDDCIRRIDRTLREILAGKSKEPFWNAHERCAEAFRETAKIGGDSMAVPDAEVSRDSASLHKMKTNAAQFYGSDRSRSRSGVERKTGRPGKSADEKRTAP